MADDWSRRAVLGIAVSAVSVGLAGCSSDDAAGASPTGTTSTGDTPSPSPTGTRRPETLTAAAFGFDATVGRQSTAEHPARIELTFTNEIDEPITVRGGELAPFSFFWNEPRTDDEILLMVPVLSDSADRRQPLAGLDDLPTTPSAERCWAMTDPVVDLLLAGHTTVEADETLTQPLDVYDLQYDDADGVCNAPGEYEFVNEVELVRGPHTPNGGQHPDVPVTLRFALTADDDATMTVTVPGPVVG